MPGALATIRNMVTFHEPARIENFVLDEQPAEQVVPAKEGVAPAQDAPRGRTFKAPRPLGAKPAAQSPSGAENTLGDLAGVRRQLRQIYGPPGSAGLVVRDFVLGSRPPLPMLAVYRLGVAGKNEVTGLVRELMYGEGRAQEMPAGAGAAFVAERLLPGAKVQILDDWSKLARHLNAGDTVFFGRGWSQALVVSTSQVKHRQVGEAMREQIIRGPHEAFGEDLDTNLALVRNLLRTAKLASKELVVGSVSGTPVVMLYLAGITNPKLVDEVWRRLTGLDVDYLNDSGVLEQLIEDKPHSLFPQTAATERPDRVAALLAEGRVALFCGGAPWALVVPVTLFELLHTGEDTYLRWPYGNFLRIIRNLAFYLSFLLPGTYLAVVLFHQEMVPVELLLSLAAARERVPFPSLVELLIMELSFDLIREAGERAPGILGTTIGIVGALILGQAAVQAAIVSPILVIIVAITALANFAIPDYSMSFAVRVVRFAYIFLGAFLGFLGIALGLAVQIATAADLKSFGVPYLAPVAPQTASGADVLLRGPVWQMERRPDYLGVLQGGRQPRIARRWAVPPQEPGR